MSISSRITDPLIGFKKPETILNVVVFPQPLDPSKESNSPFFISRINYLKQFLYHKRRSGFSVVNNSFYFLVKKLSPMVASIKNIRMMVKNISKTEMAETVGSK